MSVVQKQKNNQRNFEQEAAFQVKLLEQKAREDFLTSFSQYEDTTQKMETFQIPNREDGDAKVYISSTAKSILEKWMYDHRLYCYPTKTEKQALAMETGLSVQKISNWFINSRRRMLPKMLQTEGKNPVNFTISRKKKKLTPVSNSLEVVCPTNFLSNYAIAEENKIIDQTSIFYGNDSEMQPLQRISIQYDRELQELIVPYTETEDDESKSSELTAINQIEEQTDQHVTRGILYDQETNSKCLFILISSTK